jgi:hypothetical protein
MAIESEVASLFSPLTSRIFCSRVLNTACFASRRNCHHQHPFNDENALTFNSGKAGALVRVLNEPAPMEDTLSLGLFCTRCPGKGP